MKGVSVTGGRDPPPSTDMVATKAGGMRPIGMHYCLSCNLIRYAECGRAGHFFDINDEK